MYMEASTCLPEAGEPHSQAVARIVAIQHRAALRLLTDVEQPAVGGDTAASRQTRLAVAIVQVPCGTALRSWGDQNGHAHAGEKEREREREEAVSDPEEKHLHHESSPSSDRMEAAGASPWSLRMLTF